MKIFEHDRIGSHKEKVERSGRIIIIRACVMAEAGILVVYGGDFINGKREERNPAGSMGDQNGIIMA